MQPNHTLSSQALKVPNSLSSLPQQQRGASVTGIILLLIGIIVGVKLLVAIVPAQIGDYQLTKTLAAELKKSNDNKETSKQYLDNVNKQLSINADYDTKAEDILTFTSERAGELAIHKKYEVTNNFFGNVDIVNKFEGDISAADSLD